jgi:hypothetical protein
LVVTLYNPGERQVTGAELYVTVGNGDHPTHVLPSHSLGAVQPRDTVVEFIPVSFGGLSWGEKTVRVEVVGLSAPRSAADSASSYPWALIILAVLIVQLVFVLVHNAVRRRARADEAHEPEIVDMGSALAALDAAELAVSDARRDLVASLRNAAATLNLEDEARVDAALAEAENARLRAERELKS